MASITSTGFGSGLDINGIVTKLVDAERSPTTARLNQQEAGLQAKISSFGNYKSALSSFRDSLANLKNLESFQKITATSSDNTLLTATADTNADPGNYKIEVKQLAQSHTLASSVFASSSATLGTGTLTIKFGSDPTSAGFTQNAEKGTLNISIDASNNTLSGIRDAINKANAGVSATILYDGNGYRLVLNSSDSGAKNSLQLSITGDGDGNDTDTNGLSALAYNASAGNMTQTRTAKDAIVSINGLDIRSATNTLKDTLKGVTLNLLQVSSGKLVDVSVSRNNNDAVQAVQGFIKGFNELNKTVKSLSGYDAASKKGGILQGDAAVNGGMVRLRAELANFVKGLNGSIKTLADIGIETQSDGSLSLDSSKFNQALSADRNSVAALFAVFGRPTDPQVQYLGSTENTKAGEFSVNITQAATQGVLYGLDGLSLNIDTDNDTFRIKVDGVQSGEISLTHGSYTSKTALAAEIQARINGDSALKAAKVSVNVTYDNTAPHDRLMFTSNRYGADSQVAITHIDTNSTATLGLSVAVGTPGRDVAGTIDSLAATGAGQTLTAAQGEAMGLKLKIVDAVSGDHGKVSFSRGLVERLERTLTGLLETKGVISAKTDGLQKSLDRIQLERQKLDTKMTALQDRLLKQFNAMDTLVAKLQSTGNYLTQQFNALNNQNRN